jgi:hypothetical protein
MQVSGHLPSINKSDIQLDYAARGRWTGYRKRPRLGGKPRDRYIDMLPRLKLEVRIIYHDKYRPDARREVFYTGHHTAKIPNQIAARIRIVNNMRTKNQIRNRLRATRQRFSVGTLARSQRYFWRATMIHLPFNNPNLARCAYAVHAVVLQVDSRPQSRIENGLPIFNVKRHVQRLHTDPIHHARPTNA